jgi:anaerobic magnesium-protoporphyrin IX monomethyl ester cyclase
MDRGPGPAVALILPPTQSFFMPYSSVAALAAWLQQDMRARTLVIDAGLDWLSWAAAGSGRQEVLDALKREPAYRDAESLRHAYEAATGAVRDLCAPWMPEHVDLAGQYHPGRTFDSWPEVFEAAHRPIGTGLFDAYVMEVLIPQLQEFGPGIVGLSVPFDWMIFPTIRLAHLLTRAGAAPELIIGGHAVTRLWHDHEDGFFQRIDAGWFGLVDGEGAFRDLVEILAGGSLADGDEGRDGSSPLIRLPASPSADDVNRERAGALGSAIVPDYSDLPIDRYLRPAPILPVPASDGCFFGRCRFCSRQRADQAVHYVERAPSQVADVMRELSRRHGCSQFILAEDIVTHRFMLGLADALRDTELTWFCEASFKANLARRLTEPDCATLYAGGCRLILNGLESASARVRDAMDCPVDQDLFDRNLANLVAAGIVPYVTMIFGYPGETPADVRTSAEYIRRQSIHSIFACSMFWVVPQTDVAREAAQDVSARLSRASVLDGGFGYSAAHTVSRDDVSGIINEVLPGLFAPFATFIRAIPVLMQLLVTPADGRPFLAPDEPSRQPRSRDEHFAAENGDLHSPVLDRDPVRSESGARPG